MKTYYFKLCTGEGARERKPMYQPDWYNDSFKPDANKKETK